MRENRENKEIGALTRASEAKRRQSLYFGEPKGVSPRVEPKNRAFTRPARLNGDTTELAVD
jgi:hypothetical protein